MWECLNRIRVLEEFNRQIRVYTNHSVLSHRSFGKSAPADEIGANSRETLNRMTPRVARYLAESGNYPIINVRMPPAAGGGVVSELDAITNLFNLSNYDIPLTAVSRDVVQKAIGYHQDDLVGSFFRTINPLWWLWKLAVAIIRIPFKIISWAGYDSAKVEGSSGGKVYKAVAGVATFIVVVAGFLASLVQILDSQTVRVIIDRFFR